jgi:hypothetical protein
MQGSDRQDRHERFKELCALEHADALSIGEGFELEEHLRICEPCREVYEGYALVSGAGMAFLGAPGELPPEARNWDNRDSWEKIFSTIQNQRSPRVLPFQTALPRQSPAGLRVTPVMGWIAGLVAACMIAVIALGAYHAGARKNLLHKSCSRRIWRRRKPRPVIRPANRKPQRRTHPPSSGWQTRQRRFRVSRRRLPVNRRSSAVCVEHPTWPRCD